MRFIFAIIPVFFLLSCLDEPPCIDPNTSPVKVSLYSALDGNVKGLAVEEVYIYSPNISLLENETASSFEVPLYPDKNQVFFVIKSQELTDSLLLGYESRPQLFASNCDVKMEYFQVELIASTFDSVQLFLNDSPPEIEIYY